VVSLWCRCGVVVVSLWCRCGVVAWHPALTMSSCLPPSRLIRICRLTQQLGGRVPNADRPQAPSRTMHGRDQQQDSLEGAGSIVAGLPSTLSDLARMTSRDLPNRQPSDLWHLPSSISSLLDDFHASPR